MTTAEARKVPSPTDRPVQGSTSTSASSRPSTESSSSTEQVVTDSREPALLSGISQHRYTPAVPVRRGSSGRQSPARIGSSAMSMTVDEPATGIAAESSIAQKQAKPDDSCARPRGRKRLAAGSCDDSRPGPRQVALNHGLARDLAEIRLPPGGSACCGDERAHRDTSKDALCADAVLAAAGAESRHVGGQVADHRIP